MKIKNDEINVMTIFLDSRLCDYLFNIRTWFCIYNKHIILYHKCVVLYRNGLSRYIIYSMIDQDQDHDRANSSDLILLKSPRTDRCGGFENVNVSVLIASEGKSCSADIIPLGT